MNNTNNHSALGALNDAINALNVALSRAAELDIPLELWARSTTQEEANVKRWHVCLV
jgi:hypothetical protein